MFETRCKAKPGCSPPGYPPHRLLIIVDWSVNWFACIQRSTCTSCRIPSHASVKKMPEGEMTTGENVCSQGVSVVPRCTGVVSRNYCSRPRVLHFWRSSVSWMNLQSLLLIGHCVVVMKKCVDWINKNWLPWQRPLSNPISQQSSMPIRLPILKSLQRSVAFFLK